jgi:hypothetical protein
MSKIVRLFLAGFLAVLGMASALAQTNPYSGFRYVNDGNTVRIVFGPGTSLPSNFAPVGSPALVGNMGVTAANDGVRLHSKGSVPLPGTGGTVPVDTKLKLSGQALGKALARTAVLYNVYNLGSDLINIWQEAGMSACNDGRIIDLSGNCDGQQQSQPPTNYLVKSFATGTTYGNNGLDAYHNTTNWSVIGAEWGAIHAHTVAQIYSQTNPQYNATYTGGAVGINSGRFVVPLNRTFKSTGAPGGTYTEYVPMSTENNVQVCPTGYTYTSGQCFTSQPASEPLTEQEITDRIAAQSGWPSSSQILARATAQALNLPNVQSEVTPILETLPASNYEVEFAPGVQSLEIGEPLVKTETQVLPNGNTQTITTTTTNTATVTNNNTIVREVTTIRETIIRNPQNEVVYQDLVQQQQQQTPQTVAEGEDLECGLPNTPACKIDEDGTPEAPVDDGVALFNDLLPSCMRGSSDWMGCLPELPDVNWAFQLPSTCSAISIPGFQNEGLGSIDLCQFQSVFHDIMTMLWAAAGLFGAIAIVSRTGRNED